MSILLYLFIGLLGCKSSRSDVELELRIAIAEAPRSLDPDQAHDLNSQRLISLIAMPFFKQLNNGELFCNYCESYKKLNSQNLQFSLKELKFSDGTPIRTDDVEASLSYYASKGLRFRGDLSKLLKFIKISEKVFQIVISQNPQIFIEQTLTQVRIFKNGNSKISHGPLIFEKQKGSYWHFKPNPYWHKKIPYKKITFWVLSDPLTRYFLVKKGDLDISFERPYRDLLIGAKQDKDVLLVSRPGNDFQYIGLNQRHPHMKNKAFRYALAHAIERQTIIDVKYQGQAQIANTPYPSFSALHNSQLKNFSYDLNLAKEYLKTSKVANPSFELLSSTDRQINSIQEAIIHDWKKIGVHVTLVTLEWGLFYDRLQKGAFDAVCMLWANVQDTLFLKRVFHSQNFPPGRNRIFYKNPLLDNILDIASTTDNPSKRLQKLHLAQEILLQEMPYIPLWHQNDLILTNPTMKGVQELTQLTLENIIHVKKTF